MRTLTELYERSRVALANPYLVEVAAAFSPTAAYDFACQRGFSTGEAQSTRYLAMIRRDYGKKGFHDILESHQADQTQAFLQQAIVPRIRLLESVTGAPLRLVYPPTSGMTFTEWFMQRIPMLVEIKLEVGAFRVDLYFDMKVTSHEGINRFSPLCRYAVLTTAGQYLAASSWGRAWLDIGKERDVQYLRQYFLRETATILGDRGTYTDNSSCIKSVIMAVLDYLEANGERLPPRLRDDEALTTAVAEGAVEQAEARIAQIRVESEAQGVRPTMLTCLDYERWERIAEVKRIRRYRDASVPLLDKVKDGTVQGCFNAEVIPGSSAANTYDFFLYHGYWWDVDDWVKSLKSHGYAGSRLFCSQNIPSGKELVGTGQVHGLLLGDNFGYSSKEWWLNDLQDYLQAHGFPRVPQYIWADSPLRNLPDSFSRFLSRYFPLS